MRPTRLSHWSLTRQLAVLLIAVVVVMPAVGMAHVPRLDAMLVLGLPAGLLVAGVGLPLLFILLAAWFARRQQTIDGSLRAPSGVAER